MAHGQNSEEALPKLLALSIGFMSAPYNKNFSAIRERQDENFRQEAQIEWLGVVFQLPRLGFRGAGRSVKRAEYGDS